jgi:hypothetical protein
MRRGQAEPREPLNIYRQWDSPTANEEHVAILKKGVAPWNAWRDENPDIRPDLRAAHLSGANLRGAHLYSAHLRATSLSGRTSSRRWR